MSKNDAHSKGQYFTTNIYLKQCVYDLIQNNPDIILEPSIGQGDLIDFVCKQLDVKFHGYEIDEKIPLLPSINQENNTIVYDNFLVQEITTKYHTIIGNPPYVKTPSGNLYLDFIIDCFRLLRPNGELIFIVPSDFFKLTSSTKIIQEMLSFGSFTHAIYPNQENLFENASIDVVVFRYCKNPDLTNSIMVNGEQKYLMEKNGIVTFSETICNNQDCIGDYFDIYVGMVTGCESIFKNEKYGNVTLIDSVQKIFIV